MRTALDFIIRHVTKNLSKTHPRDLTLDNFWHQKSKKQLKEIAEKKMADLNAHDVDEAAKIIAGSARSMGIEVVE